MSKFCGYCGAQLKQNARFCGGCGARIAAPKQLQAQAATPRLSPAQSVPTPALTSRQPSAPAKARINGGPGLSSVGRLAGSAIAAPSEAGEITFGVNIPQGLGEIPQVADPVRVLVSSVGNLVRGVGSVLRDKKRWIPALVLAIVWFVLSLLPTLDMDSVAVQARGSPSPGGLGRKESRASRRWREGSSAGSAGLPVFVPLSGPSEHGSGLDIFSPPLRHRLWVVALACGTGVALIGYNFWPAPLFPPCPVGIASSSRWGLGNKTSFLCSFLAGSRARKRTEHRHHHCKPGDGGDGHGLRPERASSALNLPAFHLPTCWEGCSDRWSRSRHCAKDRKNDVAI